MGVASQAYLIVFGWLTTLWAWITAASQDSGDWLATQYHSSCARIGAFFQRQAQGG